MGYLVLSRRPGETVHLTITPGTDPERLLRQLRDGISITLIDSTGHAARIAIDAPPAVTIMREELVPESCLR